MDISTKIEQMFVDAIRNRVSNGVAYFIENDNFGGPTATYTEWFDDLVDMSDHVLNKHYDNNTTYSATEWLGFSDLTPNEVKQVCHLIARLRDGSINYNYVFKQ